MGHHRGVSDLLTTTINPSDPTRKVLPVPVMITHRIMQSEQE